MPRIIHLFVLCLMMMHQLSAQTPEVGSRNGQVLPVHGTFRILVVFVEIEYPGGTDKFASEVGEFWKPKNYPAWANDLFDANPSSNPKGLVSKYFHECSFGDYQVVGDILLNPENPGAPFLIKSDGTINTAQIVNEAWEKGFMTKTNLPADSFDLWKKTASGTEKIKRSIEEPLFFDHIMFIVRNSTYPGNLAGYASAGNLSAKGPVKSDSYSVFTTRNANPINILLHEFNHLLLGGNNVHCCGGNHAASGPQMFMSFQGGWGMMGAANKSLLTCNGWDRYKLGWKYPSKEFFISATNLTGAEINTDFDFSSSELIDTLVVLRDFVTTGDVIRIKLPGIPSNEYQQWLWIENHQTQSNNQSPFDIFQYENSGCTDVALPGLYTFIQVDHNDISGKNAFGGNADFIRSIPASGMYDLMWGDTMVRNNWCVGNGLFYPFERLEKFRNPLTGNAITEIVPYDNNHDGYIDEKEKRDLAIEKSAGEYHNNLPYLGESEMAFRIGGNSKMSIGTNPSTASTLTLLNDNKLINNAAAPDNRIIYLNAISIEIIKENYPSKGDILVRVRNGDNAINSNVRWCAPHIVLPKLPSDNEFDLVLNKGKKLLVDAGLTPTQPDSAIQVNGIKTFSKLTHFDMLPGTRFLLKSKSKLILRNGSVFHISKDAEIVLEKGAKIVLLENSRIINDGKITKL